MSGMAANAPLSNSPLPSGRGTRGEGHRYCSAGFALCHWNCFARAVTVASTSSARNPRWTASVRKWSTNSSNRSLRTFLVNSALGRATKTPRPGRVFEDPFPFQLRIDAGHGVGVDHQQAREVADRGQAVLRLHPSPRDGLAKLLRQLPVDRQPAGGIDLELHAAPRLTVLVIIVQMREPVKGRGRVFFPFPKTSIANPVG